MGQIFYCNLIRTVSAAATGSAALLLRDKNPIQSSFLSFVGSVCKKSDLVRAEVKLLCESVARALYSRAARF